jgi:hypothetical protein
MATVGAPVMGPDEFIKGKVLATTRVTHHASLHLTHYAIKNDLSPAEIWHTGDREVWFPYRYLLPQQREHDDHFSGFHTSFV